MTSYLRHDGALGDFRMTAEQYHLICGVPAIARFIQHTLIFQLPTHYRGSIPSLLIDEPRGFAHSILASRMRPVPPIVVVTWNRSPALWDDLWDQGPHILLAGDHPESAIITALLHATEGARYRRPAAAPLQLTAAERHVLRLTASATPAPVIAQHLKLQPQTVRARLAALYAMLEQPNAIGLSASYWDVWPAYHSESEGSN